MTAADWVTSTLSLLAVAMSGGALIYSRRQALAAEAMIPPPPPKVAWRVSRMTANTYLLNNVGTEAARSVEVAVPGFDPSFILVDEGSGDLIRPEGQLAVKVIEVDSTPDLVEFHVTWDGQTEPVAVSIPGW